MTLQLEKDPSIRPDLQGRYSWYQTLHLVGRLVNCIPRNDKTQVKTGDKFGTIGWWVNRNLADTHNPIYIEYPDEEVPGSLERLIFVYSGTERPTDQQMKTLIDNTPSIYPDAKY